MKYFPPVKISFSSLNHLTVSGADPVKSDFKTTCDPGDASRDSGFEVKAGGSGGIWEEIQQISSHPVTKPVLISNGYCLT